MFGIDIIIVVNAAAVVIVAVVDVVVLVVDCENVKAAIAEFLLLVTSVSERVVRWLLHQN